MRHVEVLMRVFLICSVVVFLVGCVSNSRRMAEIEEENRLAEIERERVENEWRAKLEQLKPGMLKKDVEVIVGKPSEIEFAGDAYFYSYNDQTPPMILMFRGDNGKLYSWGVNGDENRRREKEKMARYERALMAAEEQRLENERRARVWQAIGGAAQSTPNSDFGSIYLQNQQNRTSCTSRRQLDGSVQTECD